MAIDLSTPEGRSSYLNDKLSDLINGVDSTYGNIIFDELLKRIDSTIKDFNTEMESVFDELKTNEKKRQSLLTKLKKKYTPEEAEKKENKGMTMTELLERIIFANCLLQVSEDADPNIQPSELCRNKSVSFISVGESTNNTPLPVASGGE